MEDNKYYTEQSPQMLNSSNKIFINFLKETGYNYENQIVNIKKIGKINNFVKNNLSFFDLIKFTKSLKFKPNKNITLSEWLNNNSISSKGKNIVSLCSKIFANSPDKILAYDIFEYLDNSIKNNKIYHFKDNNSWINHIENKLIDQNVDIFKGYSLIKLDSNNNLITTANIKGDSIKILDGKKHILTFPPNAFKFFLENQNDIIKNNWMDYTKMIELIKESSYTFFSFQFHFKENLKTPNDWFCSCASNYKIFILPISKYVTNFNNDPDIKTVWSCKIIDTSLFIKDKNKYINNMTKEEIIENIKKELNITPYKTTIYDGVQNINGRWTSTDSGFSVGKLGVINSKGNINNLYTVGPHNITGINDINKAVKSAK